MSRYTKLTTDRQYFDGTVIELYIDTAATLPTVTDLGESARYFHSLDAPYDGLDEFRVVGDRSQSVDDVAQTVLAEIVAAMQKIYRQNTLMDREISKKLLSEGCFSNSARLRAGLDP